jgi:uncharacterized membrane protein YccC
MTQTHALKARSSRFDLKEFLRASLKRFALHPFSLRFALGLWAGSSLAFYLAFLFQIQTPQWAGVSVWIMFMQSPRLNYSKIMFWMAGTLSGAVAATVLIVCFAQTPELFLFSLSLWLAMCAALATQLREYRAYGAVLAGYTAAIVSFTAVSQPDQIFEIAVTRVSCVALGVACAILAMTIFLPKHLHWRQTLHYLNDHCRRVLEQATIALDSAPNRTNLCSWGHVVERLSTLEHTFDFTLAESADSRARSAQTRSLTATLFCLAAKAQAVEFHLLHAAGSHSPEVREIQERTGDLIKRSVAQPGPELCDSLLNETAIRRKEIEVCRNHVANEMAQAVLDRFLLDQLDGMLLDLDHVLRDRAGLYGPWSAPRPSCLSMHRDLFMAGLYALRIFLAMGLATGFWFATEWPSGSSFLLFLAVVCSLLSLLDHAENLGMAFLKSVAACFAASFIELFWILQKGEGFPFICVALGLFLVPAAYAYTHPRLAGSAVISMLLFYGLVAPANLMAYDIGVFLNNAIAFLAAAAFGFFAFHVVRSPAPSTRQRLLLKAMRSDLKHVGDWKGPLREQRWVSLAFDRLRILHRFGSEKDQAQIVVQEALLHAGLLWGLRQIGLKKFLEERRGGMESIHVVKHLLETSRDSFQQTVDMADEIRQATLKLWSALQGGDDSARKATVGVLAELQEMSQLLQATGVRS